MALEYLKYLATNRTQYDDSISILLLRTIEGLHVFLETNKKKLFNNTKVFCQLFDLSNLKETTKVKKVFNTKGVLLPWPKKTHSMLRTTMKDFVITQQCLMIRSDSFHREKVYSCGIRPIIFSLSNISFVEVKLKKKLFLCCDEFFCIPATFLHPNISICSYKKGYFIDELLPHTLLDTLFMQLFHREKFYKTSIKICKKQSGFKQKFT